MRDSSKKKNIIQRRDGRMRLWLLFLLALCIPRAADAATLENRYPGLSSGFLQSAVLEPLDEDTLLMADDFTITRSQLLEGIKTQDPKIREQLEKNMIFLLEQETVRRVLLNEAKKQGIDISSGNDQQVVQSLFEKYARSITVFEDEARAFYESNKEMVGGAAFEQVADSIQQYLLQDKKQQAFGVYIDSLGSTVGLRINETWAASQNRLALDNPVDKARRSGTPTLVEFGAAGCVPCDMMQPILDKLRKAYPQQLNVVFVHVGEEQVLAARYGIRSIPVQVFYDAAGKEVFRHVGFFAQTEVDKQLTAMGVRK